MNATRSLSAGRGGATRNELKRAARRLFAERGIAATGMREIVEAAGQRNAAAVHYYFGGKDDLLRELLIDGADLIDVARQALIDEAEANGVPDLRAIVRAMVISNVDIVGEGGENETYFRFMINVQNERRQLFTETMPEHSEGYARYIAHVRRLLADVPEALMRQRILYAGLALGSLMTAREAALDASDSGYHPYWSGQPAIEGMIDAVEAILTGPATRA
ncbi:TetR/AcrR family transcriptional regulator [uncultured Sphingomonas sp.]|uniref:TetR/AcrR family transcriptional regulator n=1 Tax=uncultured Sphingomonas sp. TaxID=158754 RepID=UPI00261A5EC1|nr:TetR/AcrR family transcriptional regulator [uncultured Sphingomonas sp.]